MADSEGRTPKVIVSIPLGYWELPEDQRLAAAEELAGQLQEGLPPGFLAATRDRPGEVVRDDPVSQCLRCAGFRRLSPVTRSELRG